MKLSKTSWIILGIGIFVIAFASLYMLYQGQVQKHDDARNELSQAQAALPMLIFENDAKLAEAQAALLALIAEASDSMAEAQAALSALLSERKDLETELSQLEDEMAQWQNKISQLEAELAQAKLTLKEIAAGFPGSVESIEYDEKLFRFAHDANLKITSLLAEEPMEKKEGVTYSITYFTVEVDGEVADILNFIKKIVADEDFKTAVLKPITLTVPEPLTETEKEGIKEAIRAGLTEEEKKGLTKEEIDKLVNKLTAEEIAKQEMPSAIIKFGIYTYQGE